jgi:hypothetical protein
VVVSSPTDVSNRSRCATHAWNSTAQPGQARQKGAAAANALDPPTEGANNSPTKFSPPSSLLSSDSHRKKPPPPRSGGRRGGRRASLREATNPDEAPGCLKGTRRTAKVDTYGDWPSRVVADTPLKAMPALTCRGLGPHCLTWRPRTSRRSRATILRASPKVTSMEEDAAGAPSPARPIPQWPTCPAPMQNGEAASQSSQAAPPCWTRDSRPIA